MNLPIYLGKKFAVLYSNQVVFNGKLKIIAALSVLSLLHGCAATSIFGAYPDKMKPIKAQVDAQQYTKPLVDLNEHRDDADKILYMMERGRIAQLSSDKKASMADFRLALEEIAIKEDKAKISLSDTGAQTASLLTNDNAIPYEGEGYERVFLHHFQAMNYLFTGDMEGALVEVRAANNEQKYMFQQFEDEVAKSEEKAREHAEKNKDFMSSFKAMADIAGRVKNSFQNAYTFYASGVLYEMIGKENDAYIDYKKALEIYPDNPYIQKDVIRLAKKLAMNSDLERFQKSYNITPEQPAASDGSLVVFFEHGFAPPKMEASVPVFTPYGLQKAAFPIYLAKWQPELPLLVSANGQTLGETRVVTNVQALATKALQEKLPTMMVRQVLRIIAKREANKQSEKVGGLFSAATQIFNLVTEKADRRSWLTLPNDAQIFRGYLPEGEHELKLTNGIASQIIKVKVAPQKTTIVRVVGTGKTLHSDFVVM